MGKYKLIFALSLKHKKFPSLNLPTMSKNFTQCFRLVIYPQDVAEITGRSLRNARALLQELRTELGKKAREFVTIKEFCNFFNFPEDQVRNFVQRIAAIIFLCSSKITAGH